MDSKVVDASLRELLWPRLKAEGFTRRSGRTAWRDRGAAVQCLSVRSFNSYVAEVIGATTYSFGVSAGVFFPAIAQRSGMGAFVHDLGRPKEHECHLRKFLTKGVAQPNEAVRRWFGLVSGPPRLGPWIDRPDVWLVMEDGSNVSETVRDAAMQVVAEGLPWLDAVAEPREAIRRLFGEPDVSAEPGVMVELYGGPVGSPGRWHAIGALAASTKDRPLLERAIEEMGAQTYWSSHPRDLDVLRADLAGSPVPWRHERATDTRDPRAGRCNGSEVKQRRALRRPGP